MARIRDSRGKPIKKRSEIAFSNFKDMQVRNGTRKKSLDSDGIGKYGFVNDFFGVKDTVADHITLWKRDNIFVSLEDVPGHGLLMAECMDALSSQSKNAFVYINKLKSLLYRTCKHLLITQRTLNKAITEINRYQDGYADQNRKRWTEEEDEYLIDMAACDDSTPISLAQEFGRTPGAITTRISYLVGVNRVSKKVAGRFIGRIDGKEIEANIDGILTKSPTTPH